MHSCGNFSCKILCCLTFMSYLYKKNMKGKLIVRHRECGELQKCLDSEESEFPIVCGRRRIGKTFLVEQFFDGRYDSKYVGGHNLRTREQLNNFSKALQKYSGVKQAAYPAWPPTFRHGDAYLTSNQEHPALRLT